MIRGTVTSRREAVVPVMIHGGSIPSLEIEAVIDTGFDGHLTLSDDLIEQLGLSDAGTTWITLADGSESLLSVYEAHVAWDGGVLCVEALESQGDPLLGMAMLEGYRLTIDVVDNGAVEIAPLPQGAKPDAN